MYAHVNSAINHKGYMRMTEFGITLDISRGPVLFSLGILCQAQNWS